MVPLFPDVILAVAEIDWYSRSLLIIDLSEKKFKSFCDAFTCEDKFSATGYFIRINDTLFMTATPYHHIERRTLDVGSWKISGRSDNTYLSHQFGTFRCILFSVLNIIPM